ncbi:MAG: CPBP family glutamic-type intramembrane protease [Nanoarchaeota archaeon]
MIIEVLFEISLLFIFPIILLRYHLISSKFRFATFLTIPFIIFCIILFKQWSFADVGLRTDNIFSALFAYGIFTLLGIVVIIGYAHLLRRPYRRQWWRYWHFQIGFLILAFLQQFVFQGFLVRQLQLLGLSSFLIVIIPAFFYILIHLIYEDFLEGLPLLILAGVGFSFLFLLYQNLFVATLSHAILNFIAVLYGFFSKPYRHRLE